MVPGDQSDVDVIRLQEHLQGRHFQGDCGDLKFTPPSESAGQELGLKRPGVSDQDLHGFRFSAGRWRSNVDKTICFHCTMMPERVGNGCRLHHNVLVMNPRSMSTFVEPRSYTGFAAALSGAGSVRAGELNTNAAFGGFITFSMVISCPVPQ